MEKITELIQEIEGLCHENEVAKLLLQENWPPAQKLSASATLNQGCKESLEQFRSRMPISDPKLLSTPEALEQFPAFLSGLIVAIQQTRLKTFDLVQSQKKTRHIP